MSRERHSVLIVDDDPEIRQLLRQRLEGAGYRVRLSRTGEEALTEISSHRPGALVLDLNMPGLDGFGVLTHLQRARTAVPTLVLTARHAADDVRLAIKLGAKDYLTKPFNEAQLLARVLRLTRPAVAPLESQVLV